MLDSAFCTLRRLVGCSLAEEMWSHLVHNFHWTVVEIWSWLHQFSGLPLHSQTSQNLPKERKQNHHHTRSYLLWEWTVINHKHNDAALMQHACSPHAARMPPEVVHGSRQECWGQANQFVIICLLAEPAYAGVAYIHPTKMRLIRKGTT